MLVVYWRVSYSCKCDSRPLSCHLSFWKRDKRLCECKRRAYGWCLMKRCTFATLILCGEVIFIFTFQKHLQSRVKRLQLEARLQSLQGMGVFWWFLTPPIRRLSFCSPWKLVGGLKNLGRRESSDRARAAHHVGALAGTRTTSATSRGPYCRGCEDMIFFLGSSNFETQGVRCKLLLLLSVCFLFPIKNYRVWKKKTGQRSRQAEETVVRD